MKKITSLILVLFVAARLFSQDTLPKFTLIERGNRVTISWVNPFKNLVQLNVQKSLDTLRNFSTIYSAPSPELPQNGYTDTKPATNRYYYRIFYVLEGGSYFFSRAKRGTGITDAETPVTNVRDNSASRDFTNTMFSKVVPGDKRVVTVKTKDNVIRQLSINSFRNFRDSILRLTKDTLYAINDSLVTLSPYGLTDAFRASVYIYVNKDGLINVALPLVNEKKYHIKFFEENGTSLFDISNVRESPLILDKSNFVHSGWFQFELYEDNKLKEKNKLYIPKDF